MNMLEFVLSTRHFMFDGKIYKRIYGAPMGSPLSVVVSMGDHAERFIQSAPPDRKPTIWKRYMDEHDSPQQVVFMAYCHADA